MKSYIEKDWLVVAITHQEACRLNSGESLYDRRNPLWSEAKVEVRPYGHFDSSYEPVLSLGSAEYQERMRKMRCVAEFFTNSDVVISVLPEVSRNALIAAEMIRRENIITMVQGDEREQLLASLTGGGIVIRFDGTD
jgi:hypothetical protein